MKKIRDVEQLRALADGTRTAQEIASLLGWPRNTVKNLLHRHNLPRRGPGQRSPVDGANNPAWRGGSTIGKDGYRYESVDGKRVLAHRRLMAEHIGRELDDEEVVDHIDGLTLHNDVTNLRLFASNAEHLRATLTSPPLHSSAGLARMRLTRHQRKAGTPVSTYDLRRKRGDVRLHAILLLALRLGKDSPHLSGTRRWMRQAGIDPFCDLSLQRAYQALLSRYAEDLTR